MATLCDVGTTSCCQQPVHPNPLASDGSTLLTACAACMLQAQGCCHHSVHLRLPHLWRAGKAGARMQGACCHPVDQHNHLGGSACMLDSCHAFRVARCSTASHHAARCCCCCCCSLWWLCPQVRSAAGGGLVWRETRDWGKKMQAPDLTAAFQRFTDNGAQLHPPPAAAYRTLPGYMQPGTAPHQGHSLANTLRL